jgi:hypothetical protein
LATVTVTSSNHTLPATRSIPSVSHTAVALVGMRAVMAARRQSKVPVSTLACGH